MLDYMKHYLPGIWTGIQQTEARNPQKKEAVEKNSEFPLAAICQLLQIWIGKIYERRAEHIAFQMTPTLPDLDNSSDLLGSIIGTILCAG